MAARAEERAEERGVAKPPLGSAERTHGAALEAGFYARPAEGSGNGLGVAGLGVSGFAPQATPPQQHGASAVAVAAAAAAAAAAATPTTPDEVRYLERLAAAAARHAAVAEARAEEREVIREERTLGLTRP
jgi:hypothetical protein